MEAVFGSVAAVIISVVYGTKSLNKQKQLVADLIDQVEQLEDQMLTIEKNVDERLVKFDLDTGTKMVRVVTPLIQATKKLQDTVGV